MTDIAEERTRLLVKVSHLYYMDGLNQQEIAERLGISRPQISRMLSAAKAQGIVQISIRNPYSEEQVYERVIAETFGIHDVIIIQMPEEEQHLVDLKLARAGAALLESVLKDYDTVGIMAGRTVSELSKELNYFSRKHMKIVPLIGGWGAEGATWHANSNARVIGEKLKAKYLQLNAPAIVGSKEVRDTIVNEPEISKVVDMWDQVNVAVVGISQVTDEASVVKFGYFGTKEMNEIKSMGAVGGICTSFLDEQGHVISYPSEQRLIGMNAETLRRIPNVIATASGLDKVPAICSVLRGKWVNVLVTDMATAKAVLEWHHAHPVT